MLGPTDEKISRAIRRPTSEIIWHSQKSPVQYFKVEIDHENIPTFTLLPSADSFKKGWCPLQANVCARITV